jgi:hypothetical protein
MASKSIHLRVRKMKRSLTCRKGFADCYDRGRGLRARLMENCASLHSVRDCENEYHCPDLSIRPITRRAKCNSSECGTGVILLLLSLIILSHVWIAPGAAVRESLSSRAVHQLCKRLCGRNQSQEHQSLHYDLLRATAGNFIFNGRIRPNGICIFASSQPFTFVGLI